VLRRHNVADASEQIARQPDAFGAAAEGEIVGVTGVSKAEFAGQTGQSRVEPAGEQIAQRRAGAGALGQGARARRDVKNAARVFHFAAGHSVQSNANTVATAGE
jgi:hypothetical protein